MINSKLNYLYKIEISDTILLCKKEWAQARLKMLSKNVLRSHIFDTCF